MGDQAERLLASEEVEKLLKISRPTLYLWVKRGKLKPVKIGRRLMFPEEDILRLQGHFPRVDVRFGGSGMETALVRDSASGVTAEILSGAGREALQLRIDREGDAGYGRTARNRFQEAKHKGEFVYLGGSDSAWIVDDVRMEERMFRKDTIVYLRRTGVADAGDRRAIVARVLNRVREGYIRGEVASFSRDELHERNAS